MTALRAWRSGRIGRGSPGYQKPQGTAAASSFFAKLSPHKNDYVLVSSTDEGAPLVKGNPFRPRGTRRFLHARP